MYEYLKERNRLNTDIGIPISFKSPQTALELYENFKVHTNIPDPKTQYEKTKKFISPLMNGSVKTSMLTEKQIKITQAKVKKQIK